MTELGIVLCLLAAGGIIYPHVLYPLVLRMLAALFTKPVDREEHSPSIDICIAAYNEERYIGPCLNSIFASSFPTERMHVIIGDDGSTDKTLSEIEMVAKEHSAEVTTLHFPRTGKNGVMNALVEHATADIVVFTDADCVIAPDALDALVASFGDPQVGAAIGKLDRSFQKTSKESGERGEATYKSIEDPMNLLESAIHSTVTSNGSLYAVRRGLLTSFPNNRVADDWYNVLRAALTGLRVIYVPTALVAERRSGSIGGEIARTVRTAAAGMVTLWYMRSLLVPTSWVSYFLWSHRVIRWMSPVFLLTLLIGTFMTLEETTLFGYLFYSQFVFYALALLGYAASTMGQRIPIVSTISYFVAMNGAFAIAVARAMKGSVLDKWEPSTELPDG